MTIAVYWDVKHQNKQTNAYNIEMNFCLNMCILMGNSLPVFLEMLSFNQQIIAVKIQKSTFLKKKKMVSSLFSIKFKCKW